MNIMISLSKKETHIHNTWRYMRKRGYFNRYVLLPVWDVLKSFRYALRKDFISIFSGPSYDRYIVTIFPFIIANKLNKGHPTIFFTSFPYWEQQPLYFRNVWKHFISTSVLVTATDYAAISIRNAYGIDTYSIIPHSIDTNEIGPIRKITKEEQPTVIFVGRMVYEKGVLDLLKIAKKMRNINFWFIGKGDLSEFVSNMSRRFKNIYYYGYVDRQTLIKLYNKAWVFILPSFMYRTKSGDVWNEFFGVSILESLSCETPVIASDAPGPLFIKKYVGKSMGIFKQRNINDLMAKISFFVEQGSEYLKKLGHNGRKRVIKYFSSYVVSRKWAKIFSIVNSA